MALASLKNRIKKAQGRTHAGEYLGRIAELIAQGAYYDELTDEEKTAYCDYLGTQREAFEQVYGYIMGSLHIPIEKKPKPLTEAQFRERAREVEGIVNGYIKEYNAPEARADRERQYQELQRIGALRAAAFHRGEPMDKYPLPWEKKPGGIVIVKERKVRKNE